MMLHHGNINNIKAKEWYIFELRSEDTVEATMRRVCHEVPYIFEKHPIEIFIPVGKRDIDQYDLMSGPYFYARTDSVDGACRLRSITGVAHLVTSDGNASPKKALRVDQSFIDSMVLKSKQERDARCANLVWGSFVRIMDSEFRDFCGHVDCLEGDRAIVKIEMLTKQIFVNTPTRNLMNLSHVPPERRVFYYGPLVEKLTEESLIQSDLHTWEADDEEPLVEESTALKSAFTRSKTVSRFVRELVARKPELKPIEVAEICLRELKGGDLRKPKNLFMIYGIIKVEWLKVHKQYKDWWEVSKSLSKPERLTSKSLGRLGERLGLHTPLHTPAENVKRDGRSKRQKRR